MVVYRTHTQVAMGSNSCQVKNVYHLYIFHVVLYTVQRIALPMLHMCQIHHTSMYDPVASVSVSASASASATSTLQVHAFAVLEL